MHRLTAIPGGRIAWCAKTAPNSAALLLEPPNKPAWVKALDDNGFAIGERYISALQDAIEIDPRLDRVRKRLQENGVTIRGINHGQLAAELAKVHELCLEAFAQNVLYALSSDEFIEKYLPYRRT